MLHNIRVASPCSADWEKMEGNDRVRFCSACQLNVYNFSEMSEREILKLIQSHEGRRLCGRLYRRKDGTILTRNCPVGLRAVVRSISRVAGIILSFMTPIFAAAQTQANGQSSQPQSNAPNTVNNTVLKVKLVGFTGTALRGMDVALKQKGSKKEIRAKANKNGEVLFPALSDGDYLVKVKSDGYQIYRKHLQLHGGQTILLPVFAPPPVATGRVLGIIEPPLNTNPTVDYTLTNPK